MPNQKTDRWQVTSHDKKVVLGIIRFYPQWRCYVSEPKAGTVWSWECHKAISEFINEQTQLWRESIRARKNK